MKNKMATVFHVFVWLRQQPLVNLSIVHFMQHLRRNSALCDENYTVLIQCCCFDRNMAPFRWPTVANNLQLATEVAARRPNSPSDWEVIAVVLSQAFSTDDNQVELSGRACRERMDRLLTKYNEEDKKSLKK